MSFYRLRFLFLSLLSLAFILPVQASIIITEIMYNPSGSESANEYIELYNDGPEQIPLNGYTISDGTGTDELIPIEGEDRTIWIEPGGYLIILDRDYLEDEDQIYDDQLPSLYRTLTVPDAAIGSGGLSNTNAETITLRNPSGILESERTYRLGAENGQSEERIDLNQGSEDSNWGFSLAGGSPGRENTIRVYDYDLGVTSINYQELDTIDLFRPVQISATVKNHGLQNLTGILVLNWRNSMGGTFSDRESFDLGLMFPGDSLTFTSIFETPTGGFYFARAEVEVDDDQVLNNQLQIDTTIAFVPGSVRISEIMADPPDAFPAEWVELANFDTANYQNARTVYLQGWKIRDAQGTSGSIVDVGYNDYRLGYAEPGRSRFLIAQNESLLEWSGVENEGTAIPETWPSLNNDGDSLFLVDPFGTIIDRVAYPEATPGKSQVRLDFTQDAGVELWVDSPEETGGTPGREEDIELTGIDFAITSIDTLGEAANWSSSRYYTAIVTIENLHQSGTAPDSINLRLTWKNWTGEDWDVQTSVHRTPVPAPGNVHYETFRRFKYGAGSYDLVAELLSNDDDSANDMLEQHFDFPYPYRHLSIDEVMAAPGYSGGEWIELRGNFPEDLNRWYLEDAAGHKTYPHTAYTNVPYSSLSILVEDSAAFVEHWPEVDPEKIIPCSTWATINDGGDLFRLYDPSGTLIHQATLPASEQLGVSLVERGTDWSPTSDPAGGTPGRSDHGYTDPDTTKGVSYNVEVFPNPFSPDGDGHEDTAAFRIDFPASYAQVIIRLFDMRGRQIAVLFDGQFSHGHTFFWDGQTGLRQPLKVGMYVWSAEITADHRTKKLKGTLVCAGSK